MNAGKPKQLKMNAIGCKQVQTTMSELKQVQTGVRQEGSRWASVDGSDLA